MMSQVTNSPGLVIGDTAQSTLVSDSRPHQPTQVTLPGQPDKTEVTSAAAKEAAATINRFMQQYDLQFSVDADTKTQIVKVVDNATQEVIRQMPSQEMIVISKALDRFQGLLLKGQT